MSRRLAMALAAAVVAVPLAGEETAYTRTVLPGAAGPNRLPVDLELLAAAAAGGPALAGLNRLRLHDAREVPYLLVSPPAREPRWEPAAVRGIARTKTTSGFEADLGAPVGVDRLRLSGLPAPFLKRVRLEGSGDRQHWTLLVEQATVFDLPDERLSLREIVFPAGEYRYLRLTWDDRASAVLPLPSRVAARRLSAEQPPPLRAAVPFERRPSEPGRSRFRLRLPSAGLPVVALELQCGGGHILRLARVSEARLEGGQVVPVELGSAVLRRVVRGDLFASELGVEIAPPQGPDLDLVIEDGPNPPLGVQAVVIETEPLPWIYFESESTEPLLASFARPGTPAPRYDLEAIRPDLARVRTAQARWGETRAQAVTGEPPPGEPLAGGGGPMPDEPFRYARAIAPGPRGLNALVVDGAVLAHSRDLADVRIADETSHQVPYLVERLPEPLALDLPSLDPLPPPDRAAPGLSRYRLDLPYDRLPASRLVLGTTARVFERRISVWVERPSADPRAEPRTDRVASAVWRHADPERAAPELVLELPALAARKVVIELDEGENQPLPLAAPRLLLPAYRLRFFRTDEGALRLLYGNPRLPAPRYDLALLAPRLLGASAREVTAEPETALVSPDRLAGQRKVFWAVLAVAVLALLALIVRLVARPATEA